MIETERAVTSRGGLHFKTWDFVPERAEQGSQKSPTQWTRAPCLFLHVRYHHTWPKINNRKTKICEKKTIPLTEPVSWRCRLRSVYFHVFSKFWFFKKKIFFDEAFWEIIILSTIKNHFCFNPFPIRMFEEAIIKQHILYHFMTHWPWICREREKIKAEREKRTHSRLQKLFVSDTFIVIDIDFFNQSSLLWQVGMRKHYISLLNRQEARGMDVQRGVLVQTVSCSTANWTECWVDSSHDVYSTKGTQEFHDDESCWPVMRIWKFVAN